MVFFQDHTHFPVSVGTWLYATDWLTHGSGAAVLPCTAGEVSGLALGVVGLAGGVVGVDGVCD